MAGHRHSLEDFLCSGPPPDGMTMERQCSSLRTGGPVSTHHGMTIQRQCSSLRKGRPVSTHLVSEGPGVAQHASNLHDEHLWPAPVGFSQRFVRKHKNVIGGGRE